MTSNAGGINCGTICAADFDSGTSVTLTATPAEARPSPAGPAPCSGSGSCAVTFDTAKPVTATFSLVPQRRYSFLREGVLPRPGRDAQATGDCKPSNPRRPLPYGHRQNGLFEDRAQGPRDLAEAESGIEARARLEGEPGRQLRQKVGARQRFLFEQSSEGTSEDCCTATRMGQVLCLLPVLRRPGGRFERGGEDGTRRPRKEAVWVGERRLSQRRR